MKRLFLILGLTSCGASFADESGVEFFREKVKPILEENCFKCHGGVGANGEPKVRGGLQLISRKGLMLGGDHGPTVDLENPEKSLLLEVLSYENEELEMPPRGELSESQQALILEWLRMGAPWTPEDADRLVEVHEPLADVTTVNQKTLGHWSYRLMLDPEVPDVDNRDRVANPVDAFILEKLEAEGLSLAEAAPKAELLRRLSYDLTGLPPTLEEIRAFENDGSPDAWQRQVDRLLASPAYGEKWARHWLDLVRYAESNGFERDADKPGVWRYRDYVIRSMNEDKPYDRFLTEQLAGDEIENPTVETMVATGYHRLMQFDDEPADKKLHEFDTLDDIVRVTTEGMLGMTVGCARCHDHKGDPIPQSDYYRFMAFFRGIKPMERGKYDQEIRTPDALAEERRVAAEREKRRSEITGSLKGMEDRALAWVAGHQPSRAAEVRDPEAGRVLLKDGRAGGAEWYFTTRKPGKDWNAVGFRAERQGWKKGRGAFGTEVPNGAPRTPWTTKELWLQTTFLLEDIPKGVAMSLHHDEDCEVYLNGQLVLSRKGFSTEYLALPAPEEFMGALQTGRNVISVHVRQSVGGQFFDLGLSADRATPRELVLDSSVLGISDGERKQYRALLKELDVLGKVEKVGVPRGMIVTEVGKKAPPTRIHIRGNPHAEGEEVVPGFPVIFGGQDAVIEDLTSNTSGRRLALAKWITDPENPRTARVMVNRIWQHHFGRGLSPSPSDFGFLGEGVTHPELLDWLARQFVASGWSIKAMHRLILGSNAYRMSSRAEAPKDGFDADNSLLWKARPRRLTAEEVRDSMLLTAGVLNRKMHGPSVYIPLPKEVLATSSTKGNKWGTSPPEEANRRSVYVKVKRSLVPPEFTNFDFADTDGPCPVRFTTTVPTQALGQLNSEHVGRNAQSLVERLKPLADDRSRVHHAFEWALSREPTADEVDRSLEFLRTQREELGMEPESALQRFAVAIFNLNEFLYLD